MEVFRDIRAVVMDLDDTLISAYRRPDLLWRTVCQQFRAQLGALEPEEAVRALTRSGQAFWGDPKRHALGRLSPSEARRIIVADAFEALLGSGRQPPSREVAERMADAFSLQRDRDMRLEPGADALLAHLGRAGYRLALLTNGAGLRPGSSLSRRRYARASVFSLGHRVGVDPPTADPDRCGRPGSGRAADAT